MNSFNLSERQRETMDKWRFCPMANFICPTARETKNEINTPRGLALTAYLFDRGLNEFSQDAVSAFYECSLGGLCKTTALDDSDIPELVRAVRAGLVAQGKAPVEVYILRDRIMRKESLEGQILDVVPTIPYTDEASETLYFGTWWYSQAHEQLVRAGAELLKLANISFTLPRRRLDTGVLLYELGFHEEVKTLARELLVEIEQRRIRKVILASAYDLRALTRYYPELAIQLPDSVRLEPLVETIRHLLEQGQLRVRGSLFQERVAYLEPSYLVHELHIVQSPRRVLECLVQGGPVPLRWEANKTRYCGGGALQFLYPRLAKRVISRVVRELVGNRAIDLLVTECPFCTREVQLAEPGFTVTDLPSLVLAKVGRGG